MLTTTRATLGGLPLAAERAALRGRGGYFDFGFTEGFMRCAWPSSMSRKAIGRRASLMYSARLNPLYAAAIFASAMTCASTFTGTSCRFAAIGSSTSSTVTVASVTEW